MKITYEEKVKNRKKHLKLQIHDFSSIYLEKDMELLCYKLVDIMSKQDNVMFMQSKTKNWTSAIIYLIAKINHMFENMIFDTLNVEIIDNFFNTKSTFYRRLAERIDDKLKITENEEFHIKSPENLESNGHFCGTNEGDIYYIDNNGFRYNII